MGWQNYATSRVYGQPGPTAQLHLQKRLRHWPLSLLPGLRLHPSMRNLQTIGRCCQPRVWAAVFRLLCNGWGTSTRFGGTGPCKLGCGCKEDSIRHLAYCPIVCGLLHKYLGRPRPQRGFELDALLGLDGHQQEEHSVIGWAQSIYALYRLHNGRRHGLFDPADVDGAFNEFLREARRGSAHDA